MLESEGLNSIRAKSGLEVHASLLGTWHSDEMEQIFELSKLRRLEMEISYLFTHN